MMIAILKKFKRHLRQRKIKRQVVAGLRLIASANRLMAKDGWPRQRRREFWREFVSKANKMDAIAGLFDEGRE